MTEQDYKNFNTMFDAFVERCEQVEKIMYEEGLIDDYTYNTIESYSPEEKKVHCYGYDREGDYCFLYIPSYLLYSSDDDVRKFAKDEIKKQKDAKKRAEEKEKEQERLEEIELYKVLKAKYGNKI